MSNSVTPSALPKSIINALPVGAQIAKHVQAIEALYPQLEKELAAAYKSGAVPMARAFVVLHRLHERLLSDDKSLKQFKSLWKDYKELKVPELFEQSGVPNISLDEGFRVGIAVRIVASIVPGMKEGAYAWLEKNDARDLIQETVNASTLSAYAKQLREKNKELPDDLFKVSDLPNTSVTKT